MVVLATVLVGLVAGVLSGMFGIGGGIVTTPAIRLLLGYPALVAVGTPLIAIIPSAIAGAVSYHRSGVSDTRAGLLVGIVGSFSAVLGAWLTRLVGGQVVLLVTAGLILFTAGEMLLQAIRPPKTHAEDGTALVVEARPLKLAAVGLAAGVYSGFLGLGGGFVLVPMLTRWLRFPIKRAVGTSLVAIALLAVPGAIAHAVLGNIDWVLAIGLVAGVVPGALIGARVTLGASDRFLRVAFAAMLIIVGVWLGVSEVVGVNV